MVAFTADNHIGVTSQWSLKERGEDFMRSFADMVDKIVGMEDERKTLIIGGDLFDSPLPPSFAVEFVQGQVRRLHERGCTVYGIDGNHDISEGRWLRVCGIQPLSDVPTSLSGAPGLTACGVSYRRSADLVDELMNMVEADAKCDILVLHLALGELNRMGAASDVTAAEMLPLLKKLGTRLVLMGHIHIRQSVVVDGVTFAYCGSTEVCSMNEQKDKSFELVDPETLALSRVPIKTRPIEHTVIGTEAEFAKFTAGLKKDSPVLQSVFVAVGIADGVKRLRALAKERNALMRIQTISADDEPDKAVDRSAGVLGLEQAIELSFSPDSVEAGLIRAFLRSPGAVKLTVDKYLEDKEGGQR